MSMDLLVGMGRRFTLYGRAEYRAKRSATPGDKASGRTIVASMRVDELARNVGQMAAALHFLRVEAPSAAPPSNSTPDEIARALRSAIKRGDVLAVAEGLRPSIGGSRGVNPPSRPRSNTVTPSQLFKRAASAVPALDRYAYTPRPTFQNDGLAAWYAKPGDRLPDGRIAQALVLVGTDSSETVDRALSSEVSDSISPLGDVQALEYTPDATMDDVEELAASTNNPRYAAKMLGYDQNTFSDMLHVFKPANGLGPADNVIFHDDGGVEFNGQMLDDNIHNYAP